MNRTFFARILIAFALLSCGFSMPASAQAASATFFGPIVPPECNCEDVNGQRTAADYGCVLATIQNVINFGVTLGVMLFTLALAYAGFVWMTSLGNAEKRSQGRNMLINVFIGLAILLSAWLIVDFIMKKLYSGDNGSTEFGPWNSVLSPDATNGVGFCIDPSLTQGTIPGLGGGLATGVLGSGGSGGGAGGGGGSGGGGSCTAIPDSQLESFPTAATVGGPERGTHDTVTRFMAMRAAAARDGINLRVSDGYRSPDEQTAAWNNNGCHLVNGRAQCARRTAAVPCSMGGSGSNHTSGNAVDIRLDSGVYAWLRAHASQYGFYNNLANDRPHWSSSGR
jgi:hypothetical protein